MLEKNMIKVEEIADKYKGYEIDEKELEKILVRPKPKTVWDLKKGDCYYYFNCHFEILKYYWSDTHDYLTRAYGNVFLTKQEAYFELQRRKIETIFLKYGRRFYDTHRDNYSIGLDDIDKTIKVGLKLYNDFLTQGTIYFDTQDDCWQAIKEAGEDNIKKYIFGIKDGYMRKVEC